jgi:pSer/pThr/pTyr-binding forkhead associated (FHA) protein
MLYRFGEFLEDLVSKDGTYLCGERIEQPLSLSDGDRFGSDASR